MRLFDVVATAYRTLRKAPGKAVVLQLETDLGEEREIELYQQPGIASGPTKGDKVATINLGGYRIGVATHNYRIDLDVTTGATTIYSTNSNGDAVQARIDLTTLGEVKINGDSKTFVTHAELNTALQNFITALNTHTHPTAATGPPSPPTVPLSIDISAAETTTVKTGG